MANAYFRNMEGLTAGENINGPQVQFKYAGRLVQIPVPDGVSPIVAANDYIRALRGGFGNTGVSDPQDEFGDNQLTDNPDDLIQVVPANDDDVPSDVVADALNESNESANAFTNAVSDWNVDGINSIKGYQPGSHVPVLTVADQGIDLPVLEGFFQGVSRTASGISGLPQLFIRRGFVTGTGGQPRG